MAQIDHDQSPYRQAIDGTTPSKATYLAVAKATGRDPMDLPPLRDTIDTDSLDALVERAAPALEFTHTFEYAGCSVTVTDEEVLVEVADSTPEAG